MVSVEIEATGRVEAQLIVVREAKRLIGSWWTGLSGVTRARVISFCDVELSHPEDDRLMATGLVIIEKVGVQACITQIYDEKCRMVRREGLATDSKGRGMTNHRCR